MPSVASDPAFLLVFTGIITLTYLAARKMFGHDPREPPLAPQSLPNVGQMVGLSRSKFNYYVDLSPIQPEDGLSYLHHGPPRPEDVRGNETGAHLDGSEAAQDPRIPAYRGQVRVQGLWASLEAQDILAKNVNDDEGDFGLSMESYTAMRDALKPGPQLDDMNRVMINEIAMSLDLLQPAKGESRRVGMYAWLRDAITRATTRSVYSPVNPYEDKAIADAFCLMSILVRFLPSLTARKPVAARSKVAKAFEAYYRAGGVEKASALAQNRYQAEIHNNVPLEDIARYEVGGSIAILVNTAPSAFWTLLLLNSHPGLRDDIRKEVDACTTTAIENGSTVKALDITTLKESCPLLLSYQEVLRHRSMGTSVREVMEDTYLDR
ncbi:Uu.00g141990.m01.CDS01 [Anthostomella pinea]|uniref:Uu.00g141990.m01.CDS01 n=1 Tax=Anthostomella pinea TaxID=933095 RepID=A0AAI8VQD9_9PEZI|nr:Uu.00g141990.m01.CDS01 [Anthostomella pinea]